GGARSRSFYGSLLRAGDDFIALSRISGAFLFKAEPAYKPVAQNRIANDPGDFNGSPVASDGRLYLRSNRHLYCIGEKY
ncbi:MAG: serine/threonine protein kinase, partial [Verrucomicrobiota bacterium]